jgi:hypothetical protein
MADGIALLYMSMIVKAPTTPQQSPSRLGSPAVTLPSFDKQLQKRNRQPGKNSSPLKKLTSSAIEVCRTGHLLELTNHQPLGMEHRRV